MLIRPEAPQQSRHSLRGELIETMIQLSRLAKSQRIAIAGDDGAELYQDFTSRGFQYCVLAPSRTISDGCFSAGMIAGNHDYATIEAAIVQVSRLLHVKASMAIAIGSSEIGLGCKVRARLQRFGFRVDAGARCHQALVLAAHRDISDQQVNVFARAA
jgi:hypothetical protein